MGVDVTRSQWFLMSKGVTEEQIDSHTETGLLGCHWCITGLYILLIAHWVDRDYVTMLQ